MSINTFVYITGEVPKVGDRIVYSDKGHYGQTYAHQQWPASDGNCYAIAYGDVGTLETCDGSFLVRMDTMPTVQFDLDPRLFERAGSVSCTTYTFTASPVATCICGITVLMSSGCICGAVVRYKPPGLK